MNKTKKTTKYLLSGVAGVLIVRALRTAYHRSRFERLIDHVVGGEDTNATLNQALVDTLPKAPHDWRGRPTEPFCLLLIGDEATIRRRFEQAGWREAVPINASNWARAFWAGLRDKPYPTGPTPPGTGVTLMSGSS